MVQEMLGLCEAEDGTEIDELLQAGASWHKRARQDVKTNSSPGIWQVPAKKARDWKIEEQRKELLGRNITDCQMSLRWRDSWRKKVHGFAREKNAVGHRSFA